MDTNPVEYETPNSLAAIWSMMLPGLGQLMKGQIMPGIFWAFFVAAGYFSYFWPGLALHALCILDAGFSTKEGSFVGLDSWPKRIKLMGVVFSMVGYIVLRNHY